MRRGGGGRTYTSGSITTGGNEDVESRVKTEPNRKVSLGRFEGREKAGKRTRGSRHQKGDRGSAE